MMGAKTRYAKAVEFLKKLKGERGELIQFEEFKQEFMKTLGSDVRQTVRPYMRLMMELKLIQTEGQYVRIK